MLNSNFEEILKKEPLIDDLINNNQVNLFSNYPEIPDNSTDFLNWISPKYLDVFNHIYNESISNDTEGKLLAFLKTPAYCDSKTYEAIIDRICKHIEQRNTENEQFLVELEAETITINEIYNKHGFRILKKNDVVIFNTLDHPKIEKIKSRTLNLALKVLQKLKAYNHKDIGMILHNQNIELVKKINLDDDFKNKFSRFIIIKPSFELDTKTLISIVVVIIIIVRIYFKLRNF